MFASGSHLAVSASVHLSPELMGTLSATAFRSRGKMPSFWDTGRWLSVLPHIWNRAGLILPIKQGSAGVHPAGGWIPQPSDVLTPTGRLWAGCVSSKRCHPEFRGREKCNYIVLHEKWNETDREREGGWERRREAVREIQSYYLCSDNSLAEMEGLWWWAQCVFLWCQSGELRIIYSWVYISNAFWLAKLLVLLASGLYNG